MCNMVHGIEELSLALRRVLDLVCTLTNATLQAYKQRKVTCNIAHC